MARDAEEDLRRLAAQVSDDVRRLNPHLFDRLAGDPDRIDSQSRRKNKYNARRTEVDGQVFDSKKEAARYVTLRRLEQAGVIQDLRCQVRYKLADAFTDASGTRHRAIHYTADFVYTQEGITYIEDVKSAATRRGDAFRLRWKMLNRLMAHNPNTRCVVYD